MSHNLITCIVIINFSACGCILAVDPEARATCMFCFFSPIYFVPNLPCMKKTMGIWSGHLSILNLMSCIVEFIEKVLTIFMSYLQVVWCMMLLKHAKWNLRVHFFSSSHCYAQSNIWNTLIWFTPLTIYVPKKIHKLLNNIFGPFAILVLIVLRV